MAGTLKQRKTTPDTCGALRGSRSDWWRPSWHALLFMRVHGGIPSWHALIFTRVLGGIPPWHALIFMRVHGGIPSWHALIFTRVNGGIPPWHALILLPHKNMRGPPLARTDLEQLFWSALATPWLRRPVVGTTDPA